MGPSRPPRKQPRTRRRAASDPIHDVPDHLPFGHQHDESDEPHNLLQDAFEHFFAGLGDALGHMGRPDDDADRD